MVQIVGALAVLAMSSLGQQQRTCGAVRSTCFRGSGTIARFSPGAPESASAAACCAACLRNTTAPGTPSGCVAWQLGNESGKEKGCWLLPDGGAVRPSPHDEWSCLSSHITVPNARANRSSFSGVWFQNGEQSEVATDYFVLGGDHFIPWRDIEVADGVFDFSSMDETIAYAVSAGFFTTTGFMVGEFTPEWIYNRKGGNISVPKVTVEESSGGGYQVFPYYLDQTYQALFLRGMKKFAAQIATYPAHVRSRIVAAQAMYGSTGDDCPWHCKQSVNGTCIVQPEKYMIDDAQWHNFTMSTVKQVCNIYGRIGLPVLWNTNFSHTQTQFAKCPGSYLKAGSVSHGFQVNNELDKYETEGKLCRSEGTHCRGESFPFDQHGYYLEEPMWATYSQLLWQLTFGVDMPGLSTRDLANASYAPLYETFNRYAASVRPPASNWAGAIVALRDGLDANDTARFPVSKFGALGSKALNVARLLNIVNDPEFKARGAREGDPVAGQACSMASRHRNASNDAGMGIFAGNYGNGRIVQRDPQATSVGWWHIGPKDQPYGRFARGFQRSSNKTQMSFTLDPQLWGGLPRTASSPPLLLTLRVAYFNGGNGASFNVSYDSIAGCRTAAVLHTDSSGRWQVYETTVADAAFGKRCNVGADIALRSTSTADAIVQSIEIFDQNFASLSR